MERLTFQSEVFEPGPGRLARGPGDAARAQGLIPQENLRSDPFWQALINGDQRLAIELLNNKPAIALEAVSFEGLCYGGFGVDQEDEEDYLEVWTPAFNAAIQLERFELALALAERGAPLDFTDVAWDRIKGRFSEAMRIEARNEGPGPLFYHSPEEKMNGIVLQMLARLPAAYATRPDWLMELSQPHHQRHSMLNMGRGLGTDSRGGPRLLAPSLLAFDTAFRSGRFGRLPVPAWAGQALSRWALAADRDVWSENAELLAVRGRCLDELWAASIAAGGDPFGQWVESGKAVGLMGARELFLRCSIDGMGFALERFPALDRLGAFDALSQLKADRLEAFFETLRQRRRSDLADAVTAFVQAAALRQDAGENGAERVKDEGLEALAAGVDEKQKEAPKSKAGRDARRRL